MNGWNDYLMKQEQYRDQLREAERQRLVKFVADDCQDTASRQAMSVSVSSAKGQRPSRGRAPCGEYKHLLEKAA